MLRHARQVRDPLRRQIRAARYRRQIRIGVGVAAVGVAVAAYLATRNVPEG